MEENQRLVRSSPQATKISGRAWSQLLKLETEPGNDACRVLVDAAGEAVGYAWVGGSGWWISFRRRDVPESFHLGEVIAADPTAADALLTACRLWASESETSYQQLEIVTPPEGPLAAAAAYEGGIFVARHTWRGQFMGRVLDVGRLFLQLQPELTARIRNARLSFRGELTVRTDEGEARLSITPEGVSIGTSANGPQLVAEIPQNILARLCLGAFDADDLFARLPHTPGPEAVSLLQALFPRRHPHIYPVDRF